MRPLDALVPLWELQRSRTGYEPKRRFGLSSVFCFREKRSLYSLAHLPLADGQEEERANPFQENAFSNGIRCVPFLAQACPQARRSKSHSRGNGLHGGRSLVAVSRDWTTW